MFVINPVNIVGQLGLSPPPQALNTWSLWLVTEGSIFEVKLSMVVLCVLWQRIVRPVAREAVASQRPRVSRVSSRSGACFWSLYIVHFFFWMSVSCPQCLTWHAKQWAAWATAWPQMETFLRHGLRDEWVCGDCVSMCVWEKIYTADER